MLYRNVSIMNGSKQPKQDSFCQGWGAGQSRVILAPWIRSRPRKKPGAGAAPKKKQEPEPQKIYLLLEDKKH